MGSPHDFLILNGAPIEELSELNQRLLRRETWQAMGVEFTERRDGYGVVALYRGHELSFWTLDRNCDGCAGFMWGTWPTQGYGIVETPPVRAALDGTRAGAEQPWYFRARSGEWSFMLARNLDCDPHQAAFFWWSQDYDDPLAEDDAWSCVERAIAIYRDPLVQRMIAPVVPNANPSRYDDANDDPVALAARDAALRRALVAGPSLGEAWRDTTCWPAMVSFAVQTHGPVQAVQRALWTFGIRPTGPANEWPTEFPFEYSKDGLEYVKAFAASAYDDARFDRTIADAIRTIWPAPGDPGRFVPLTIWGD